MGDRFKSIWTSFYIVKPGFFGFFSFESDVVSTNKIYYANSDSENHLVTINNGVNRTYNVDTVRIHYLPSKQNKE